MTPEEVAASVATVCSTLAQPPSTTTTTTTTLPPGGCAAEATFASIRCRLDALLARVSAESGLGAYQAKLGGTLEKARSRAAQAEASCGGGNLRKTKARLRQTAKSLTRYAHRLAGRAARRQLDDALRVPLLEQGEGITPDVKTLRTQVECGSATTGAGRTPDRRRAR